MTLKPLLYKTYQRQKKKHHMEKQTKAKKTKCFLQKKNSTKIELNAIKIPRKNQKKKSKVKLIEVAIEATVMYREKKKCHQKGASQCCYHHCCRQMMLSAYCHYGAIQQSDIDKIYGQFSSVMKTCCCKALQTVSSYNDWRQRKGFIGQCV